MGMWCEIQSLVLRDDNKLRVRARIYGPKRDEIVEGWIILHNEQFRILNSSPNII